jgi:hypothetical protein
MDQFFETFRKASESSLQIQQEFMKQWTQPWMSGGPFGGGGGAAGDAGRNFQKRFIELSVDLLNKHRQSLDSTYAAGIQIIEQTFRATDVKSPDDYRHLMEDLWRKLFDTFKTQSEAQFSAFQDWSKKSAEVVQDVRV